MRVVPQEWAKSEFSDCELGDVCRTRRLIKAAAQVLARSDGSTPRQIEPWSDCKALYRLMDCHDVSFQAITTPHYERTRQSGTPGSVQLILTDTTAINYGRQRQARGWGRLIDQVGPPPEGVRWQHVCDRGADDYEVFCRAYRNRCDC